MLTFARAREGESRIQWQINWPQQSVCLCVCCTLLCDVHISFPFSRTRVSLDDAEAAITEREKGFAAWSLEDPLPPLLYLLPWRLYCCCLCVLIALTKAAGLLMGSSRSRSCHFLCQRALPQDDGPQTERQRDNKERGRKTIAAHHFCGRIYEAAEMRGRNTRFEHYHHLLPRYPFLLFLSPLLLYFVSSASFQLSFPVLCVFIIRASLSPFSLVRTFSHISRSPYVRRSDNAAG